MSPASPCRSSITPLPYSLCPPNSFTPDSLALLLYGLAGLAYRPSQIWIRAYLVRSQELLMTPAGAPAAPAGAPPAAGEAVGYGAKSLARTAWSLAALLGGTVDSTGRRQGAPIVPTTWLSRCAAGIGV